MDKWCVELGAWDGVVGSNTCSLIGEQNYNAVLIECNDKYFAKLIKNHSISNIIPVKKFIEFDGPNSLDNVLGAYAIPKDFDFLSIDVDGPDYHILQNLNPFKPKIICIEFNPTIPNEISYIQKRNMNIKQGSSAKAIIKMAEDKNYCLADVVGANLILLRKDLIFAINEIGELNELFPIGNDSQYIFYGYDGSIISNKDIEFIWHDLKVNINKVQFFPRVLRKFPSDYRWYHLVFLEVFLLLRFPGRLPYGIKNIFRRYVINRTKQ